MIHEATRYTRYQSYRQNKDDTMEVKSKLYLRITLLINYMMEENLFLYVVWSSVKHAASVFPVEKNFTKKEKNKSDIWMDRYFRSRSCQFFIQKFHELQYADFTNSIPIKPQNVICTNSFSCASNFTSPSTWCTNKLRRLKLGQ